MFYLKPDSRALFPLDLHLGKSGNANHINTVRSNVTPSDGNGFHRLINCPGPDSLKLHKPFFS